MGLKNQINVEKFVSSWLNSSPNVQLRVNLTGEKPERKQAADYIQLQMKKSRELNTGKKRLDTIVSEGHGNSTQISAIR